MVGETQTIISRAYNLSEQAYNTSTRPHFLSEVCQGDQHTSVTSAYIDLLAIFTLVRQWGLLFYVAVH